MIFDLKKTTCVKMEHLFVLKLEKENLGRSEQFDLDPFYSEIFCCLQIGVYCTELEDGWPPFGVCLAML